MFNSIIAQEIQHGIDGFYCALERITNELSANCNIISYLDSTDGHDIACIQRDVFAKAFIAFSQKQWQQKLAAAGVFQRVTQALHEMKPMSDAPYYCRDYLAIAKYFVQASSRSQQTKRLQDVHVKEALQELKEQNFHQRNKESIV